MAKGKGGAPAPKVNTAGERQNGKARKKNPGPSKMEKTNFTHVDGRTLKSHEKREAWKAKGGRSNSETIPHWKTGKVYKAPVLSVFAKALV